MSLGLERLQTEFLQRTPEKQASAQPSTQGGTEAVRLRALLFRPHLSIDTRALMFPVSVNNRG